jgi:hypothetical protein
MRWNYKRVLSVLFTVSVLLCGGYGLYLSGAFCPIRKGMTEDEVDRIMQKKICRVSSARWCSERPSGPYSIDYHCGRHWHGYDREVRVQFEKNRVVKCESLPETPSQNQLSQSWSDRVADALVDWFAE